MSSFSRQQLEEWVKTIDVKADKVLDVGGSQNPITKRVKSWDVKDYKILDLAQPHECKQKPDIICDLNDYWDWGNNTKTPEIVNYPDGKDKELWSYFDEAFCLEVSEYWYNPYQALKNISSFLKPNGILYISFHFVYMVHSPKGLDYLRYTPNGCEKLLKEAGFEIIEHKHRLTDSELLTMYYGYDKMRGIKDNSVNHNVIGSLIKARKM